MWKGDFLVADIEELENLDASEIHARRLKDQEVITPKNGESFIFPTADGTIKLSGGQQDVRKSTLIRDQPEEGEELGDDLRESDGSQPKDTMTDDSEDRNFFFIDRRKLHVSSSRYSMCRRKKSFPKPLRYFVVVRRTGATLDVLLESRTDDHRNVDGDRNLSEPSTGFTQFTINFQTSMHGPVRRG